MFHKLQTYLVALLLHNLSWFIKLTLRFYIFYILNKFGIKYKLTTFSDKIVSIIIFSLEEAEHLNIYDGTG